MMIPIPFFSYRQKLLRISEVFGDFLKISEVFGDKIGFRRRWEGNSELDVLFYG